MCSRNNEGYGVNPHIVPKNLSLADIQSNLSPNFILNLKRLIVCGNFGDPLMNPELVEIFEYLKSVHPKLRIELHTNGGIGNDSSWQKLASLVEFCRFGIDGLEDTNHIYRKGVHWARLMNNINKFIDAGGNAEWAFLVFKHNEHQLELAQALSKKLGFSRFLPKRSTRHIRSDGEFIEKWPVYKSKDDIEYYIEPAADLKFQSNIDEFNTLKNSYASYASYLETTAVHCKVKTEKSIYLSVDGLVFPCCWLGIDFTLKRSSQDSVKGLLERIGHNESALNFKNHTITEIVSSSIFNEIQRSWSGPHRLQKCARTCGIGFDPFKSQF
jgi:MoaA/NifB/PqqE/SkfB family radical SAM enzyme